MSETQQARSEPGADLSAAVTVFVTTVGAPSFADCMAHLRAQDCRFTLQVIDHVAPMHAAFQRMLDDCRTPYYVQVDEDMLLDPPAVRTLHDWIDGAGPQTAMVVAYLFDVHLGCRLRGVKIFRHAVTRRYPFSANDSLEVEQVAAFVADGYEVRRVKAGAGSGEVDTLGRHGAHWTPASLYERYATLERRRRTAKQMRWFEPYGAELLARFRRAPTEENFFALMGVVAGVLASERGPAPAKDFRTYDALPGFAPLRQFLADVGGTRRR
ncbi:hypothetical protein KF840_06920 [bacterium]|nr:hypothetical protein [bacterium]